MKLFVQPIQRTLTDRDLGRNKKSIRFSVYGVVTPFHRMRLVKKMMMMIKTKINHHQIGKDFKKKKSLIQNAKNYSYQKQPKNEGKIIIIIIRRRRRRRRNGIAKRKKFEPQGFGTMRLRKLMGKVADGEWSTNPAGENGHHQWVSQERNVTHWRNDIIISNHIITLSCFLREQRILP